MILAASWDTGSLSPAACELLAAAGPLGTGLGTGVAFASLGGADVAAGAGGYGAAQAYAFDGDLSASGAEGAVAALTDLARELGASVVLLPADERTAEVAPRLAGRLGGTAVLNAAGIDVRDGRFVLTKPVFGGKAVAEVTAAAGPVVVTLRRGVAEAPEPSGASAAVETRPVPAVGDAVELLGRDTAAAEGVALEDARVIVSGGAGLGDGAAFAELDELARLLGGAVGASLAAVDAGWATPDRQVGLTGKSVAPDVYFAFGISGASQHLAGIGDAKAVVAVNTDPDAPIFSSAKLGAVTDCRAFVAALTDEFRRRSAS